MTKIITEPKELYGFLATPGIEVVNLVFASDDVVWLSWKRGAEEDVPNCGLHAQTFPPTRYIDT